MSAILHFPIQHFVNFLHFYSFLYECRSTLSSVEEPITVTFSFVDSPDIVTDYVGS